MFKKNFDFFLVLYLAKLFSRDMAVKKQ